MIPSTLCALVGILSSFAAANGAFVQRDGPLYIRQPSTTNTTSSWSATQNATSTSASTTSTLTLMSTTTNATSMTSTSASNTTTATPTTFYTTTATATSTPAPGTVDCTGIQNWQAAFAYVTGNEAIYNGQLYKAKQWTYNNAPPTHTDQWTALGTCTQPINNLANCAGVAAWSSTVAYTTGNQVTYQGHLWSAVQWVEYNAPGDYSGSWKDLGACTSTSATTTSTTPVNTTTTASTSATTTSTTPVNTTSTASPSTTSSTATSATASSTPTPGTVDCTGVQNWQAAFAYVAGNEAIYNGQLYKAKQWTYNNAPPTHADQWAALGTCTQPVNNLANCTGVAAWSSTVAYTTGGQVTYQNHLWSAVQWTQYNAPEDYSGSWKDLGACA